MERSLIARIGALSARRPWVVLAFWALLTVAAGIFAPRLPDRLMSGGFEVPGSQSDRVQQALVERFGQRGNASALIVVFHPTLAVEQPAYRTAVELVERAVKTVHGVSEVASFYSAGNPAFVSPDRKTTYLLAGLTGGQSEAIATAGRVQETLRKTAGLDGFEVHTGGAAAFFSRFNEIGKEDIEKAELVSFPITLAVLVLAFGSLAAAGLPIMLALVSLVVTLGVLFFLSGRVDMSIYVTNTASVIGIGVGIDYALFVVTRYRDELRRGLDVRRAVERAVATSGQAVALSGLTVIVALAGMFLVQVQAFSSMAIGSMTVVAVAVLAAVTLLPAALALIGRRIDLLSLRFGQRRPAPAAGSDVTGFWHDWAVAVMRRPWLSLFGSLAVLLLLAAPFGAIRLGQPSASMLPPDESPRLASERLAAAFGPGITGPVEILVETPGGAGTTANLRNIDRLTRALQSDPDAAQVVSLTSLVPGAGVDAYAQLYAGGARGLQAGPYAALAPVVGGLANWDRGADMTRLTVIGRHVPDSREAEALVGRIRDTHVPTAGLSGTATVGGSTALNVDLSRRLTERLPLVIACVLALSFVLLVMSFRSLLLPLKAMLMNLLSVGASYGLLVGTFQLGWGERLLGFTSPGHVESFVPLFLFSILFGLSMDYEVFLMSRMKEEYERTGSNELAVAHGLEATARTITSAALIMVTVFAAFAAGRLVPFKEMGFGLAVAVFLDATLVRVVLVPAAMKLMGRWNWWMPRSMDRLLPTIALERHAAESPA